MQRELEDLPALERLKKRGEMAAPILTEYWQWLDAIPDPKGKLKGGRRILRVKAKTEENRVLIAVDNSVSEQDTLPDGGGSGFGIPSVRAIAKKHGGMAGFERKDGMFEASVLLYKRSRKAQ